MLLAEGIRRGELTLDSTVGEVLADQLERPPDREVPLLTVTLRELVTHTSGLPRLPRTAGTIGRVLRLGLLGMDPYRGQSPERVLQLAAGQPLRARGSYRYSNLGGAVAGQLVAIAAGAEFGAALRDRILAPLQMSGTAVARVGATAARGRSRSGLSRQAWVLDGYAPAGGVISSTAPGIEALTPIAGVAPSAPGRAAGMFWIVEPLGDGADGPSLTWHNGMTAGYSAFLGVLRDGGRGVAVLADAARGPEQREVALALLKP
jgi:CubicO group peptidase (beta-lactamase class C family)